MTLRVAIAGASGYAGGEAARLLADHPHFVVATLTAHSSVGETVESIHPHLTSLRGMVFQETSVDTLAGHDVIIFALPHGQSGEIASALIKRAGHTLLIDLGADHRLLSAEDWASFYGGSFHQPFVYGMPELHRREGPTSRELIHQASAIAVPGCNATAITLALAPLVEAGAIEARDLQAVLAVGSSGAGRTPRSDLLGSELHGSATPYAVGGTHRHIPEIRQNLALASGKEVSLSMTPVLVPMSRGILATCSGIRSGSQSVDDIQRLMSEHYQADHFVTVLPTGQFPKTADVLGSNQVHIGVAIDQSSDRIIVISALDNLVKGTAGAAVQCMNLVFGFEETLGLTSNGVAP